MFQRVSSPKPTGSSSILTIAANHAAAVAVANPVTQSGHLQSLNGIHYTDTGTDQLFDYAFSPLLDSQLDICLKRIEELTSDTSERTIEDKEQDLTRIRDAFRVPPDNECDSVDGDDGYDSQDDSQYDTVDSIPAPSRRNSYVAPVSKSMEVDKDLIKVSKSANMEILEAKTLNLKIHNDLYKQEFISKDDKAVLDARARAICIASQIDAPPTVIEPLTESYYEYLKHVTDGTSVYAKLGVEMPKELRILHDKPTEMTHEKMDTYMGLLNKLESELRNKAKSAGSVKSVPINKALELLQYLKSQDNPLVAEMQDTIDSVDMDTLPKIGEETGNTPTKWEKYQGKMKHELDKFFFDPNFIAPLPEEPKGTDDREVLEIYVDPTVTAHSFTDSDVQKFRDLSTEIHICKMAESMQGYNLPVLPSLDVSLDNIYKSSNARVQNVLFTCAKSAARMEKKTMIKGYNNPSSKSAYAEGLDIDISSINADTLLQYLQHMAYVKYDQRCGFNNPKQRKEEAKKADAKVAPLAKKLNKYRDEKGKTVFLHSGLAFLFTILWVTLSIAFSVGIAIFSLVAAFYAIVSCLLANRSLKKLKKKTKVAEHELFSLEMRRVFHKLRKREVSRFYLKSREKAFEEDDAQI